MPPVSPVLASTTLTRITGDCEQPLERLHNHVAGSKNEVARATEERSSLKPAANQPGEVFNIKSAAISSGRTLGEAQSMHLASCPTASANRDAHQPLSPFRVKIGPSRRRRRMSDLAESGHSRSGDLEAETRQIWTYPHSRLLQADDLDSVSMTFATKPFGR